MKDGVSEEGEKKEVKKKVSENEKKERKKGKRRGEEKREGEGMMMMRGKWKNLTGNTGERKVR